MCNALYKMLACVFTEMTQRLIWEHNDGTYIERMFIRKKRKTWAISIYYKVSDKEPRELYAR